MRAQTPQPRHPPGRGLTATVRTPRPLINLTDELEHVIADLCARVAALRHIDTRRVLVCLAQARRHGPGGVHAKIVPMRFPDGTPFKHAEGCTYALPQIPTPHGDVLYLVYVYLPRFFEQPFERRLLTLIHELYHIAPAFDGTIRRFGSRAHGGSRDGFNGRLTPLLAEYLAADPPEEVLTGLRQELRARGRAAALTGRGRHHHGAAGGRLDAVDVFQIVAQFLRFLEGQADDLLA
jgi:hypothetical protein